MSQTYKIKAVKPGFQDWSNDFGSFHSYAIQVEGNGEPVNINRKSDSPAPKVGDEIYGDINDSKYGQQFKSQRKPQSPTTGGDVSRESLDTQDSIHRSVALNDAALVWQSAGKTADYDKITELADVFYAWLIKQPVTGTATEADKASSEPWPTEMPEDWLVEDNNE